MPWLLTPILMLGGTYLCYEGAEKIWEKVAGHEHAEEEVAVDAAEHEKTVTAAPSAPTSSCRPRSWSSRSTRSPTSRSCHARSSSCSSPSLITVLVYGVVGLIVKMDDIGLHLAGRESGTARTVGRGMVAGMPKLLSALSTIGIVAMLWVGGHILLVGVDELGWHTLYDWVHHAEEAVGGGALGWVVNTLASAVIGLVVGALVVAVVTLVKRLRGGSDHDHEAAPAPH